jgi:hypothetical protein
MCLRVGDPDGVQEEHKRFILVQAKECPTSSGGGESCIILHRSACSRGYKQVREGGIPRSQDVSGESVRVCAFDELNGLWICLLSVPLKWSLPSPFIDARGMQCYMHALRDIFSRRKIRGLNSCPVVGGVPLLEEWSLSFDAVATCPDMRDSMDDVATTRRVVIIPVTTCLFLRFD